MNTDQLSFTAGIPAEWKKFEERHRTFLQRYSHLQEAMNIAFLRTLSSREPIERFVFGYGRLCCEDFSDVLLLCANGRGVGAFKLLRTLYEHAVTLHYLHNHPKELDKFWDYAYVAKHKELNSILTTFGNDFFANRNDVNVTEIERRFQSVKDDFMVTDCGTCGTKKPDHKWSKVDFVTMAKQAGDLEKLIYAAYYLPLSHAHGTANSLLSQVAELDGGGLTFVSTDQRNEARGALCTAHDIILQVLEVQDARFSVPDLKDKLKICAKDYLEIWKDDNSKA